MNNELIDKAINEAKEEKKRQGKFLFMPEGERVEFHVNTNTEMELGVNKFGKCASFEVNWENMVKTLEVNLTSPLFMPLCTLLKNGKSVFAIKRMKVNGKNVFDIEVRG